MPVYEYACEKCGHEFEVEQRITDDPIKTCPSCRSRKVKRLISQTSFVLKGSGWYSDLYASKGAPSKGDDKPDGGGDDSGSRSAKPGESKSKDDSSAKPPASKKGSGGKGGKGGKGAKAAA